MGRWSFSRRIWLRQSPEFRGSVGQHVDLADMIPKSAVPLLRSHGQVFADRLLTEADTPQLSIPTDNTSLCFRLAQLLMRWAARATSQQRPCQMRCVSPCGRRQPNPCQSFVRTQARGVQRSTHPAQPHAPRSNRKFNGCATDGDIGTSRSGTIPGCHSSRAPPLSPHAIPHRLPPLRKRPPTTIAGRTVPLPRVRA